MRYIKVLAYNEYSVFEVIEEYEKTIKCKLSNCEDGYIILSKNNIIKRSDTIEELCDEFVFNSDISNYVIDKNYVEHARATILKIYKENSELDYVKAMHPKFYGAIWTSKGLIYVAKMNCEGKLELI